MEIKELDNLQIHYYLTEDSHSMDAKILNRVESELLKIAEQVSKILEIEIIIETKALEEGGIKSIYKFLVKKENLSKMAVVGAFFAGILSTILSDVIADKIKTDPEIEALKKQKIELEIKKLKQDITNDSIENIQHNSNIQNVSSANSLDGEIIVDKELIDSISLYLSENNRIKISKSKFYEYLLKEGKIEKVSTQVVDKNSKPKTKENFVPRSDFKFFIISQAEIEPSYDEDVILEIVSPVLKRNRLSWKAIYNNQNITFKLKDEEFKSLIVNKNLSFSSGTKIICDVETKLTMNNEGEISEAGKSVYNVSKIIYPDGQIVDINLQ